MYSSKAIETDHVNRPNQEYRFIRIESLVAMKIIIIAYDSFKINDKVRQNCDW
jgi:hypothetical protein